MDRETPTEDKTVRQPITKPATSNRKKNMLLGLLILVLVAAAAGGTYWWRDKAAKKVEQQQTAQILSLQKTIAGLKKQLAEASADKTACTAKAPGASTIDNIQASITSGNTAALEGYMAPKVDVVVAGAGAPSSKTPSQAVTSITTFISPDNDSWDFDFSLPASTLNSYSKGNYSKYLPDIAVVGKASNGKVIAFSFDCNAKISAVLIADNEALLK